MAKGLLENDEKFNKLTEKVWAKAGGRDSLAKEAVWKVRWREVWCDRETNLKFRKIGIF